MALRTPPPDDKKKLKVGLAVGLLVIAGAVLGWQMLWGNKADRVDDEIVQRSQEMQQSIKDANPKAPVVPDTSAPPNKRPQKSQIGRGPASAPK
jgi:hypothetical protein